MGMYTELILGCALSEETPAEVIETIKWLLLPNGERPATPPNPNHPPLFDNRINWMFNSGGSYYFGATSGRHSFEYDEIGRFYRFNGRFNIKNYDNEITLFLTWLQPWVEQGSGTHEMWAIVTCEDSEPELHFLLDPVTFERVVPSGQSIPHGVGLLPTTGNPAE